MLKFIPVRGRKLICKPIIHKSLELKFIPVRGRKLSSAISPLINCVEIYPREGTETLSFALNCISFTLKFIPVRGRKRRMSFKQVAI